MHKKCTRIVNIVLFIFIELYAHAVTLKHIVHIISWLLVFDFFKIRLHQGTFLINIVIPQ